MTKTFFIPNKQSILGEQEILTAKSILTLVDGLESHSYDAAYIEQLVDKEVQWEIDLVQITGDGSKPEDYEAIGRLDYAKFLESLPSAFYHQLDANQLEVQPILDKDFKALAQEE